VGERVEMSVMAAQVSLYPLRQVSIGPPIREAVRTLQAHGLEVRMSEMNTFVRGEEDAVFAALREVYDRAKESGDAVLLITLTNACPSPEDLRVDV
jgi:uncharacterized protein YqgV (UPF0045/DUF77 family)